MPYVVRDYAAGPMFFHAMQGARIGPPHQPSTGLDFYRASPLKKL
jgi:hypothetical protein